MSCESDLEWDSILPNMENERICATPYMRSAHSSCKNSLRKLTYTPTPKLSERKRALFHKSSEAALTDDESEPQFFASPRSSYDNFNPHTSLIQDKIDILKQSSFLSRIEDLDNDFLLNVDNSSDSNSSTIENKENLNFHQTIEHNKCINLIHPTSSSSERSSPSIKFMPKNQLTNVIIAETPQKESTPKTPYETLNKDLELPRITNRKSLVEIFNNESINEKYIDIHQFPSETNDSVSQNISLYLSPDFHTKISDPINNSPKKLPKARTSLFSSDSESPKDFGISPERFYPTTSKMTASNLPCSSFSAPSTNMDKVAPQKKKATPIFLCGRSNKRSKQRRSFNEINAGVRTGIKKIKPKLKINRSMVQSETFKQEVIKLVQTQTNSIWNKVLDSPSTSSNAALPVDQVAAIDNLMRDIKKPKAAINRKRTFTHTFSLSALHSREKSIRVSDSESNTPEKPRKFFKGKASKEKFTINIFNNIKLQVENEKKPEEYTAPIETFDPIETNPLGASVNMDEIIKSLDAESNQPPKTISADEIIMSPTSVMCNMTSGLALTSPKKNQITKAENLTNRLDTCDTNVEEKNTGKIQKLYPLFLKRKHEEEFGLLSPSRKMARQTRTWRNLDDRQYQLDAGQKRWGLAQCSHCEFVYQQGEPEEEQRHTDFHSKIQYLRFNGWKNERVVDQFNNKQTKIIEVDRNDKKIWWKKIEDVLFVVDKDLGYAEEKNRLENIYKAYFCVEKRQIVGFMTTVVGSRAHRMLADSKVDCCSTETYPVKCGVSRIWVANDSRRKGIATRMMNVLRNTFILGYRLTLTDIAFSVPSDSGKLFIKKFTNTDSYLVYND